MNIVVICDIHSNLFALKSCINEIEIYKVDLIIINGDILTYGCNPNEVIEMLLRLDKNYNVIYIKGNHEELYFKGNNYNESYLSNLKDFIKESVEWTKSKLFYDIEKVFQWKNNLSLKKVFISHANPFGNNNWSYLNSDENKFKALKKLENKNFKLGIFGHTHRLSVTEKSNNKYNYNGPLQKYIPSDGKEVISITVPSVGQPRGTEPYILFININEKNIEYYLKLIKYDLNLHKEHIIKSSMSQITKTKLISFFK